MAKFKAFFAQTFPQMYQNLHKSYSKSSEKVKSIQLTDDIRFRTKTADRVSSQKDASGLDSMTESPGPSRSGDVSTVQCKQVARNIDMRTKKGKKCGQPKPLVSKDPGPPGVENIIDKCGFYRTRKTNSKKWRTISLILLPTVVALSAFILRSGADEHPKHQLVPYEYMNIRNKRFPWGDGKKSLFHGPNNVIPEEEKANSDDHKEQ